MGDPIIRAVNGSVQGAGTSAYAPPLPAGIVAGDLLIAAVVDNGTAVSVPAGWTRLVAARDSTNAAPYHVVDLKIAAGGDAAPSYGGGFSSAWAGVTAAIQVGTFDPGLGTLGVDRMAASSLNGSASNILAPDPGTPTRARSLLLGTFGMWDNNSASPTVTPPPGMTEQREANHATNVMELASEQLTGAGAVGTRQAALSVSVVYRVGVLFTVAPLALAGPRMIV